MKQIFHNPIEEQVNLSTTNGLEKGSLAVRIKEMLSKAAPVVQEEQVNPNVAMDLDKQAPPGPDQKQATLPAH